MFGSGPGIDYGELLVIIGYSLAVKATMGQNAEGSCAGEGRRDNGQGIRDKGQGTGGTKGTRDKGQGIKGKQNVEESDPGVVRE